MKTDKEIIDELLKLKTENPDLEVLVCADEELWCGECSWYEGKISSVSIEDRYEYGEAIYKESDDIRDIIECENDLDSGNEEDAKKIEELLSKVPHKKVVYVNVGVP